MSKTDKALADVRRWLCDNLSDGEAGEVCGMLSVVSRHINELDTENSELRKLLCQVVEHVHEEHLPHEDISFWSDKDNGLFSRMRKLGIKMSMMDK